MLFPYSGIEKSALKTFSWTGGSESDIKYNIPLIENLIQIISAGCQLGITPYMHNILMKIGIFIFLTYILINVINCRMSCSFSYIRTGYRATEETDTN